MNLKKIIEKLESCKVFTQWRTDNKDCYLVHAFKMMDSPNINEWQIGYYNKERKTITSFTVSQDSDVIAINPESEIFGEDDVVSELDIEKVKLDIAEALKNAEAFQKKEYKEETPVKTIMILQHLNVGQVWNITFVTSGLKIINIKMDADSGEVKKHSISSVMDFGSKAPS